MEEPVKKLNLEEPEISPGSRCGSGTLDTWRPAAYTLMQAAIAVTVFMTKEAPAMVTAGGANSFSPVMVIVALVFLFGQLLLDEMSGFLSSLILLQAEQ